MKKQYVVVELRKPDRQRKLEEQVKQLRQQLADWQLRYHELEIKYGYEVIFNVELCDLCKAKGVSFRPALDHAERAKMLGSK